MMTTVSTDLVPPSRLSADSVGIGPALFCVRDGRLRADGIARPVSFGGGLRLKRPWPVAHDPSTTSRRLRRAQGSTDTTTTTFEVKNLQPFQLG